MSGGGFFITVIDPEIFTPAGDFRRRVAAYAEVMAATPEAIETSTVMT